MAHLNSISPSNRGRLPVARRVVYGIGALAILLNAALMHVDPATMLSGNEASSKASGSLAEIVDKAAAPLLLLGQPTDTVKASNCTNPGCTCTPQNHCGCLEPTTSSSCHSGHAKEGHKGAEHSATHANHSNRDSGTRICGCAPGSNAQGPAASPTSLSKNWLLEHQAIDFSLQTLHVLSTTQNLNTELIPEEIFHPPA